MFVLQLAEHMQRLEYSRSSCGSTRCCPARGGREDPGASAGERVQEERPHHVHGVRRRVRPSFDDGPIGLSILAAPRHDIPRTGSGCTAHISSWQRIPDTAMPMRVKCNANYQNGRLATLQAQADGYDTAILLNSRGKVAEGPGMCLFMIRDGKAVTPPVTSDILESITRKTVMTLCGRYLDMEVGRARHRPQRVRGGGRGFLLRHRVGGHPAHQRRPPAGRGR